MLTIIIAGLVTFTVIGLIVSVRQFNTLKKRYGDVIANIPAFLFAIFLALLGIYLPFYLSEEHERDTVIELLTNGARDLYETRHSLMYLKEIMKREEVDDHSYAGTLSRNDLPRPRMFLRILENEKVLTSMNEEMLASTRAFENNMSRLLNRSDLDTLDNQAITARVHSYGVELWNFENLLELFIACLEQNWSDSVFSAEKQLILRKYHALRNDPEIASGRTPHPWLTVGR